MVIKNYLQHFSPKKLKQAWGRALPRLPKALLLGLAVGIFGILVSPFRFALDLEENTGLGLLFKLRGPGKAPDDVIVVSIDKRSSDELNLQNNPDKWPRSLHARLVDNLKREGVRAVAFDVHFIEPRVVEDDKMFAEEIGNARNVILTESLVPRELPASDNGQSPAAYHNIVRIVKPIELFSDQAVATAPFTLPRIPFKVNRYWTFQAGSGDAPTVPVVAFQFVTRDLYEDFLKLLERTDPAIAGLLPPELYTAGKKGDIVRTIRQMGELFQSRPKLGMKALDQLQKVEPQLMNEKKKHSLESLIKMYSGPTSRYINYYGPPRTIKTIPYYQALQIKDGLYEGRPVDLKGKVVFVGLSEIILADRKDSFYTAFSRGDGIFVSGVEIMASVYANIRDDTALQPIGLKTNIMLVLCWGLLLGIVCHISKLRIALFSALSLGIIYLIGAVYIFKTRNIWAPLSVPLFFQVPLAFASAAGIEHSGLLNEMIGKLRMEKDLHHARDIQVSMLPEACPVIVGFQIAACSTPAREVSGDFFDFIEIDEQRLGFVIADVTGKSVSGALIMTAAKSVFRLLSEEKMAVSEIMNRANLQIKKDITRAPGMFVALLYAELKIEEKMIGLCSAGQTQPVHVSSKTGEAVLIETEGDAFPLGIVDFAQYEETEVSMESGDLIIFYTDGVVEAMNKAEEMYGFDRFLAVIKANRKMEAESFLKSLVDDVNRFVGKAEQHDDLTIVVIKVN